MLIDTFLFYYVQNHEEIVKFMITSSESQITSMYYHLCIYKYNNNMKDTYRGMKLHHRKKAKDGKKSH